MSEPTPDREPGAKTMNDPDPKQLANLIVTMIDLAHRDDLDALANIAWSMATRDREAFIALTWFTGIAVQTAEQRVEHDELPWDDVMAALASNAADAIETFIALNRERPSDA